MNEKISITYDSFGILADDLCNKIQSSGKEFSAVHGLPRGGLVLGVHISHRLKIPLIINLMQFTKEFPNGRLLIVDDLIGTGKTYERSLEFTKIRNIKYNTAVLFCKPDLDNKPDFVVDEISSWVIFPWNNPEENVDEYHKKLYIESFEPPKELVFKEPD